MTIDVSNKNQFKWGQDILCPVKPILQVIVTGDDCPRVFNYDSSGYEIPKKWYTVFDIEGVLIETEFKNVLTYGVAVKAGKCFCESFGVKYIGTYDVYGIQAMREIASDYFLSDSVPEKLGVISSCEKAKA